MSSGQALQQTTKQFAKGEYIFRLGDPGDCAYVIDSGTVDMVVDTNGSEKLAATLGAGKLFGEMAIIDRRLRMAAAIASTDCVLTVITIEQLNNRLDQLDPVLRLCLDTITGRLRDAMNNRAVIPPTAGNRSKSSNVAVNRIRLENELRNALEQQQLCLYLQPILDLRSKQVVGFESLIRWNHPEEGLLGPDRFISIAESSGLIGGITDWVFEEACRARQGLVEGAGAHRAILENTFISINLSAQDLTNLDLAKRFLAVIEKNNIPAHCVKLEITESLLMSAPDLAARTLGHCRDQGFQVAIDDFGTGFASFGYLQDFAVDGLKIDRRFVAGLATAAKDRAIVGSMINLADSLGIPVIAEGIEQTSQADVLEELGCDYVQGFLYARPLPWQSLQSSKLFHPERRAYDGVERNKSANEPVPNKDKGQVKADS